MFSIYKTLKRLAILSAHPVGEIYMTLDNNFNPNTAWGGTWERVTDRFLVGAGGSYATGATGGSTTSGAPSTNTSGSTAITTAQMPTHRHELTEGYALVADGSGSYNVLGGYDSGSGRTKHYTTNTGSGQGHTHTLSNHTHSTTPPYLAVNIWKRTA